MNSDRHLELYYAISGMGAVCNTINPRLSIDDIGPPFTLHGFNAVHLRAHGWYRVDPRGCKPGLGSDFTPPVEALAYAPTLPGEGDLPAAGF